MKKFIIPLIALLCAVLLVSCGGEANQPSDTTAAGTDPIASNQITADYNLIRADIMGKVAIDAIRSLYSELNAKYGFNITIETDWTIENKENATVESGPEVHEILLGSTNRAESRAIAEEYAESKGCYVIKYVNGKLVIWGSDDSFLCLALEFFIENMMPEGELTLGDGVLKCFELYGEGSPLHLISNEYSVVFEENERIGLAAYEFNAAITELIGTELTMNGDAQTKEILIGKTDRAESVAVASELSYSDYTIRVAGDKIVVLGGSPLATVNAIEKFSSMLTGGDLQAIEDGVVFDYDFDKLIEDSLIHRIDSFVPVWANEFTTPDWMLDYEEKLHTLVTKTGRISSDAHRGDTQNYPENSLEGILSALLLGADVVEIDVRMTKDNILVLMHDASLERTTNWASKKGKNGLPTSKNISDWTYDQLRELRLVKGATETEYLIPTAYEALQLFVKRGQIHFDCKAEGIDVNTDVYLLAEATGSKESFLYYYGIATMRTWVNKNKADTEFAAFETKMRSLGASSMRRRNTSVYDNYADAPEGWKKCFADGYPKMLTNYIYDFARFSAAEQQPTKY